MLHLRVIAFEKLGSVYRGGEERELNFLSTTASLYNTRATMQKYATAVHNTEYCAYQTKMCKNKDLAPVEPKPHLYISGIICAISTPSFTLSNGQYSLLHIFSSWKKVFLATGVFLLKYVGLKLAKNILRTVQAPWMFCHVDTVLLRVGVCAGKHCTLRPSAQSINPMLHCYYCICVFMTASLFFACRTTLLNFRTLNLHKTR